MPLERSIATFTHGRYLVSVPPHERPAGLLVGFHGYGEDAETALSRLQSIPGTDRWLLVSLQGLHRFYSRRSQDVVASWMTRQDRQLMIADNLDYVARVIDAVSAEWTVTGAFVFSGFSQGVAMAFRAACSSVHTSAVIGLGGDIPPEIDRAPLSRLRGALIGRGVQDQWYRQEKFDRDLARLNEAAVSTDSRLLDAGHEWTADFSRAAADFLAGLE